MTPEQFNKLPSWARNEITRLTSDLAAATKSISEMRGEAEPAVGRAILRDYSTPDRILDGDIVGFVGTDLTICLRRGALLVRSERNHVYVHSSASNAIFVLSGGEMGELVETARGLYP